MIRYNGQIPEEPTSWPKYNKYIAPERYQDIARNLGIDTGKTPAEAWRTWRRPSRTTVTTSSA